MLPPKVRYILESVHSLKPLPTSVTRTLKEMESENASTALISEYIGLDQALAALILQAANSAFLGYGRTCTSISEAVMRLGFKRVRSLLMGFSATGSFSRSLSGYRQGAGELWQHSLAIAVTAEWLSQAIGYRDHEEAYVSGLLHDIGKLMLDQFILADYTQIVDLIQREKMPLWQAEERCIGINHATIGGLMAEKWQFPRLLIDTIHFHHNPMVGGTSHQLAAVINLANHLTSRVGTAKSPLLSSELHPETLKILNISQQRLAQYSEQVQAKLVFAA